MGIRGDSVLVPWRPLKTIAAEVVYKNVSIVLKAPQWRRQRAPPLSRGTQPGLRVVALLLLACARGLWWRPGPGAGCGVIGIPSGVYLYGVTYTYLRPGPTYSDYT